MARRQTGTRLSVFTGREATLNRAIFHALALDGPQTIYDIHKCVKAQRGLRYTKYASVNKRARSLEESGYIMRVGIRKTKAGFAASTYELTTKTYLAILLSSISLEELLSRLDETGGNEVLADVIRVIEF